MRKDNAILLLAAIATKVPAVKLVLHFPAR